MKGGAREGAGRKKGGKNKRTLEWEALGESISTTHAARFNAYLDNCEDDKFAELFLKALEYFKPKMQRTELEHDIADNQITGVEITVHHVNGGKEQCDNESEDEGQG